MKHPSARAKLELRYKETLKIVLRFTNEKRKIFIDVGVDSAFSRSWSII